MQPDPTGAPPVNDVFLRGRLAAEPAVRVLPSGDELCSFRVVVPRPAGGRPGSDSLECAALELRVRRTLARARPGDVLEVFGRLTRRFYRSATGPASRYQVDVESLRITPGRRSAEAAARTPASG